MAGATPIVLVSGPPAAGKGFVSAAVASHIAIPVIAKDDIKEVLYDYVGTGDVNWSRRLGVAAFAVMYSILEAQLRAKSPVLLEGNFSPEETRRELTGLLDRYRFAVLELHCTAPKHVLAARYVARVGSRHPGHLDELRAAEVEAAVTAGRNGAVRVGQLVVVDTTSFETIEVDALVQTVRAHVAAAA